MPPLLSDWIRSLSDGERWLYSLAATVVGSIAVAGIMAPLVTHRLATWRDRRSAERIAAATFRSAVLSALNVLYLLPLQWPDDINQTLRNTAPTLQCAVAQFLPFVPRWRRRFRPSMVPISQWHWSRNRFRKLSSLHPVWKQSRPQNKFPP
jgi:hypothetical protein